MLEPRVRKARSLAEMLLLRFILLPVPELEVDETGGDRDAWRMGLPGANGLAEGAELALTACKGGEEVGVSSCGESLLTPPGERSGKTSSSSCVDS